MGIQLKEIFLKSKKNKVGIIVEARSNSSRLPNKHFLKILNKPILEHLINRLKKVNNITSIIIATTTKKNDDKICKLAKKLGVNFFRGSEENVTERVLKAALKFKLKIICRITGDCPIIDPFLTEQLINTFLVNFKNMDYVSNSQLGLPNGMGCEVFFTKTLKESFKDIVKTEELEHVTLNIRRNNNKFKQIYLLPPKKLSWSNLGVTLDETRDYVLIKKLIEYFSKKNKLFTCEDVIKILRKKNWIKINHKVKRREKNLTI